MVIISCRHNVASNNKKIVKEAKSIRVEWLWSCEERVDSLWREYTDRRAGDDAGVVGKTTNKALMGYRKKL